MPAVGGDHEFSFRPGLDAVLLHQCADAVFTYANPACEQFLVHARPSVFTLDHGVDGPHVCQQSCIAVASCRLWAASVKVARPDEVPSDADLQHLAGDAHRGTAFSFAYFATCTAHELA